MSTETDQDAVEFTCRHERGMWVVRRGNEEIDSRHSASYARSKMTSSAKAEARRTGKPVKTIYFGRYKPTPAVAVVQPPAPV